MAMSNDLFLAILSMDSYNREYNAGFEIENTNIGIATFNDHEQIGLTQGEYSTWQVADFYAASYTWGNQNVISYRGTDNPASEYFWTDLPIHSGDYDEAELALAAQFRRIVGASLSPDATVVLTGHSLGGALAGFTGALFGDQVVAVDHIGFYEALGNFLADWQIIKNYMTFATLEEAYEAYFADQQTHLPEDENHFISAWQAIKPFGFDASVEFNSESVLAFFDSAVNFHSSYLFGSIASGVARAGIDNVPITGLTLAEVIGDVFLQGYTVNGLSINAHSVSMNVIFQYAKQEAMFGSGANGGQNALLFGGVVGELVASLFNDTVGASAGFTVAGVNGISSEGAKMRDAIAYSALDEGALVFGNTGIRAMFDDANQLGSLVTAGMATGTLQDALQAVVDLSVQFAGLMAFRLVDYTLNSGVHPELGIVSLLADGVQAGADAAKTLYLDLSDALWDIDLLRGVEPAQRYGLDGLLGSVFEPYLHTAPGSGWSANPLLDYVKALLVNGTEASISDVLHGVEFALGDSGGSYSVTSIEISATDDDAYSLFVAGSGVDTVTGNDGNNIIVDTGNSVDTFHGGGGGDILIGGSQIDFLYGDGGDDTLIGGSGADVMNGGVGFDLVSYVDSADGVHIDLTLETQHGGDAEGDVYVKVDGVSTIEGIRGSSHDDILTGDRGFNILIGGDRNDALVTQVRGANLDAEHHYIKDDSNDPIILGGIDMLDGGFGDDTYRINSNVSFYGRLVGGFQLTIDEINMPTNTIIRDADGLGSIIVNGQRITHVGDDASVKTGLDQASGQQSEFLLPTVAAEMEGNDLHIYLPYHGYQSWNGLAGYWFGPGKELTLEHLNELWAHDADIPAEFAGMQIATIVIENYVENDLGFYFNGGLKKRPPNVGDGAPSAKADGDGDAGSGTGGGVASTGAADPMPTGGTSQPASPADLGFDDSNLYGDAYDNQDGTADFYAALDDVAFSYDGQDLWVIVDGSQTRPIHIRGTFESGGFERSFATTLTTFNFLDGTLNLEDILAITAPDIAATAGTDGNDVLAGRDHLSDVFNGRQGADVFLITENSGSDTIRNPLVGNQFNPTDTIQFAFDRDMVFQRSGGIPGQYRGDQVIEFFGERLDANGTTQLYLMEQTLTLTDVYRESLSSPGYWNNWVTYNMTFSDSATVYDSANWARVLELTGDLSEVTMYRAADSGYRDLIVIDANGHEARLRNQFRAANADMGETRYYEDVKFVIFGDKQVITHEVLVKLLPLVMTADQPYAYATEFSETIIGSTVGDVIEALAGDDTVTGGDGNDSISAGGGNDTVDGGNGNDAIDGSEGDDVLSGSLGNDFIDGGDGDDDIRGGSGRDSLSGYNGNDMIDGGDGIDLISGDAGNDTLLGGTGADTLNGGDDNDTLLGGGGADALNGDAGDDTLHGEIGADTLSGGEGDDTLFGDAGHDALSGGAGVDVLSGGDGNDTLSGDVGDDTQRGDAGFDLLNGGDGMDVLWGGTGDDMLNGDGGDDVLHGEGANDTLSGGAGHDILYGETGLDLLNGGEGTDALWGGDGNDAVWGDAGNDLLHGESADDTVHGGDGDDTLYGDTGHDLLFGDGGSDVMWGGAGNDRLEGGIGNDRLNGEGSDDILIGGAGSDYLSGSSGYDRLDGGEGDDTLTGGAADDRFVFSSGYGHDLVTDFAGNDFIVLDHFLAANFSDAMAHGAQVGGDVVFTFGDDMLTLAARSLSALNAGDFEYA